MKRSWVNKYQKHLRMLLVVFCLIFLVSYKAYIPQSVWKIDNMVYTNVIGTTVFFEPSNMTFYITAR